LDVKSLTLLNRLGVRLLVIAAFLLPAIAGFTYPVVAAPENAIGAVYTLTNAAGGNEVLAYTRAADGSLSFQGAYATGGLGSGAGLGSQGAVILTENNHWLFAVNAGSNEISAFAVTKRGLELVDHADSSGLRPISLTVHKDLLYVLNAGNSGNISGFRIEPDGSLSPLAGSTQPLSNGGAGAAPGPAQIAFSSDGSALVVTEKASNRIVTYEVVDGLAEPPVAHPSAGVTPFGFAFDRQNHAIVSEAASGSVSSYEIESDDFNVISPAVVNGQAAACWIAISKNGTFAYTTNAASGSISSYQIGEDGSLTLLNATAGLTGAGSSPVDMALSNNGQVLYALAGGAHTIHLFHISADGSLAPAGTVSVPTGVVGLAAH
jgi:6-phosphogluconolactonase (cycloisomerase 2 family)